MWAHPLRLSSSRREKLSDAGRLLARVSRTPVFCPHADCSMVVSHLCNAARVSLAPGTETWNSAS